MLRPIRVVIYTRNMPSRAEPAPAGRGEAETMRERSLTLPCCGCRAGSGRFSRELTTLRRVGEGARGGFEVCTTRIRSTTMRE